MFKKFLTLAAVFGFSASVQAIPLSVVGSVDGFVNSTTLANSSQATEENWCGLCTMSSRDNNGSAGWQLVDGTANTWAHALTTGPQEFLIKLGVGKSGAHTHYGFRNNASLGWAVIDFSAIFAQQPAGFSFNLGRISHISEFNGTVSVPEPSALALLGLGLVAIGLKRRRRR